MHHRAGDIAGTGSRGGDWAVEQVVHCFESVATYLQTKLLLLLLLFLLENYVKNKKRMQILTLYWFVLAFLVSWSSAQDRRPTISFITQPEIVTDIGGTIEMKCSVQYARDFPVVSYEPKIYQGIMYIIYRL